VFRCICVLPLSGVVKNNNSNNNNSYSNSTRLHDAFIGHAQSYPSVGLTHGLGWVGSGRDFFSFR